MTLHLSHLTTRSPAPRWRVVFSLPCDCFFIMRVLLFILLLLSVLSLSLGVDYGAGPSRPPAAEDPLPIRAASLSSSIAQSRSLLSLSFDCLFFNSLSTVFLLQFVFSVIFRRPTLLWGWRRCGFVSSCVDERHYCYSCCYLSNNISLYKNTI